MSESWRKNQPQHLQPRRCGDNRPQSLRWHLHAAARARAAADARREAPPAAGHPGADQARALSQRRAQFDHSSPTTHQSLEARGGSLTQATPPVLGLALLCATAVDARGAPRRRLPRRLQSPQSRRFRSPRSPRVLAGSSTAHAPPASAGCAPHWQPTATATPTLGTRAGAPGSAGVAAGRGEGGVGDCSESAAGCANFLAAPIAAFSRAAPITSSAKCASTNRSRHDRPSCQQAAAARDCEVRRAASILPSIRHTRTQQGCRLDCKSLTSCHVLAPRR